jgi:outer membrane protein assembly factor BamB
MRPLDPGDPERIGDYTLLARLGSGGMGEVFLGRSPGGRNVAIKVVHESLAGEPDFRARFAREVAAARRVGGAFTAPLIDADPGAPRPWLVTAYLLGSSLRDVVTAGGPLPTPAVYALGAGLAEAVISIHRAGVVHRDLTPANVLLTTDGPRVIDFGIARAADGSAVTRTGAAFGSPGYLPPEQAAGGVAGPPGDVFSLGASLVFTVTGFPPFGEGPAHVVIHRTLHQPPYLDGVRDPALRGVIAACLDKDPARRPTPERLLEFFGERLPAGLVLQGTSWLPDEVAATIAQRAAEVPPPGAAPYRTTRGIGRRRVLALGAAGLVTAGGVTAAVLASRPDRRPGLLWKRTISAEFSDGPVVSGGLVLAWDTSSNLLTALDARTGALRWRTGVISPASYPVVAEGMVLICAQDAGKDALIGSDAATGNQKWSAPTQSGVPGGLTTICTGAGLAYISAGYSRSSIVEPLQAIDVRTGQSVWSHSFGVGGSPNAPAFAAGIVYAGYRDGYFYALDAASGRLRWRRKLGPGDQLGEASLLFSAPAVADGTVYVATNHNQLHALDAVTGTPRWTATIGGVAANHQLVPGPLAAGDVVLIGGTDGTLYAIGARDGKVRWHRYVDGKTGWWTERPNWLWPPLAAGVALIIDDHGGRYGVGLSDGRVRWQHSGIRGDAVAAGGRFHAYVSEYEVASLDPATGRTLRTLFQGGLSHVPSGTLAADAATVFLYAGYPGEDTTMYAFRAR